MGMNEGREKLRNGGLPWCKQDCWHLSPCVRRIYALFVPMVSKIPPLPDCAQRPAQERKRAAAQSLGSTIEKRKLSDLSDWLVLASVDVVGIVFRFSVAVAQVEAEILT